MFGLPKKKHDVAGERQVKLIKHHADQVHKAIADGNCSGAMINYAEMHRARGNADAHHTSGNQKVWIPSTEIQNASYAFNEACVRPGAPELNGRKKRRR